MSSPTKEVGPTPNAMPCLLKARNLLVGLERMSSVFEHMNAAAEARAKAAYAADGSVDAGELETFSANVAWLLEQLSPIHNGLWTALKQAGVLMPELP